MLFSSLFPRNDSIDIHIFNALENMLFDLGICLLQLCNKLFYLDALRACFLVVAGSAGVCEFAGALNKCSPL